MRVRYSAEALADLRNIEAFLLERSASGAFSVMNAIKAGIAHAAEFPGSGVRTSDPTLRMKIVRRYGYKIFYGFDDEAIELVHIRHPARRPWS